MIFGFNKSCLNIDLRQFYTCSSYDYDILRLPGFALAILCMKAFAKTDKSVFLTSEFLLAQNCLVECYTHEKRVRNTNKKRSLNMFANRVFNQAPLCVRYLYYIIAQMFEASGFCACFVFRIDSQWLTR